jgi:hypothetical protein
MKAMERYMTTGAIETHDAMEHGVHPHASLSR